MPIVVDLAPPPGTGLDLSAVWLNTATDLSDVRAFVFAGDSLSLSSGARVEVRQLANRRRLIRRGSGGVIDLADSLQVTLQQCDREQASWLRLHTGILMCVRDHVGTKFYGAWTDVPREVQTAYRDRIDVRLSIDAVTHPEGA